MSAEPTATTDAATRRNPLGHVALVVGIVAVLLGVVLTLSQSAVIGSRDFALVGAIGFIHLLVSGLLGLGATIVGVLALVLRGSSKPAAAAGTALGASVLVGALTGLLQTVVVQLVSS